MLETLLRALPIINLLVETCSGGSVRAETRESEEGGVRLKERESRCYDEERGRRSARREKQG